VVTLLCNELCYLIDVETPSGQGHSRDNDGTAIRVKHIARGTSVMYGQLAGVCDVATCMSIDGR
jgi:hypothetical protein